MMKEIITNERLRGTQYLEVKAATECAKSVELQMRKLLSTSTGSCIDSGIGSVNLETIEIKRRSSIQSVQTYAPTHTRPSLSIGRRSSLYWLSDEATDTPSDPN
jgi:hypothetical protein